MSEERDWGKVQERLAKSAGRRRKEFARSLGVSSRVLKRLGIGYSKRLDAMTFPMRDARQHMTGVLTRQIATGEKRSLKGSQQGLFLTRLPRASDEIVYIVEGPTDTAAMLSNGLFAVGRPSNRSGVVLLVELLRPYGGRILVVGENDQKEDGRWPGRDGAETVAQKLASRLHRQVDWALPPAPAKDVRDYFSIHAKLEGTE